MALRQAGAPWTATIPLGLAEVIGAIDHAPPDGPDAMALFVIAAAVLSRPPKRAVLQPGPALPAMAPSAHWAARSARRTG